MRHPLAVANCNADMEGLIGDANRSVSTLAITTLLKTGNEGSVDKLLKQIGGFMSDIADDFKVVVVEAIRCGRRLPAAPSWRVLEGLGGAGRGEGRGWVGRGWEDWRGGRRGERRSALALTHAPHPPPHPHPPHTTPPTQRAVPQVPAEAPRADELPGGRAAGGGGL